MAAIEYQARDWQGVAHTVRVRGKRLVAVHEVDGATIALMQTTRGFTVTYGLEKRTGLEYDEAARVMGENLMHAYSCAGKLEES